MAGRRGSPTQTNGDAPVADDHNLRLAIKHRLIKQIARHIRRLLRVHHPDGCWLAAHKEINRSILAELPDSAQRRIQANFARDWVKTGTQELLEHLAPHLKEES
jgi:predicted component of type VI protein secretion system